MRSGVRRYPSELVSFWDTSSNNGINALFIGVSGYSRDLGKDEVMSSILIAGLLETPSSRGFRRFEGVYCFCPPSIALKNIS
jgi:hypothetical protein